MKTIITSFAFLFSVSIWAQQNTVNGTTTTTQSSTTKKVDESIAKSKIGYLAISAFEMSAGDLQENKSKVGIDSTYAVGMTYQINNESKIGFRQYVTQRLGQGIDTKYEIMNPVLTFSKKVPGVWGSDEISPLWWYYIPLTEQSKREQSLGKLRVTAYINWTLNPKWTLTYILDPRQSLNPSIDLDNGAQSFAKTTWIHSGNISYNISDKISVYQGVGTTQQMRTSRMTLIDESINLSTGLLVSAGPIIIIPDITNSVVTKKDGTFLQRQGLSSFYLPEETIYSLSLLASF